MFKSTSQNQQSRIDRTAEFGRVNEHGIDPETFARERDERENKRRELIGMKKEAELKLSHLRRQIAESTASHRARSIGALGYAAFKALREAEQRTLAELLAIEKQLSDLRYEKQQAASAAHHAWLERRHKKRLSFEYVFVEVAKQNLARDVYERLSTITIHRLGERYEDMEREKEPSDDHR